MARQIVLFANLDSYGLSKYSLNQGLFGFIFLSFESMVVLD